MLGIGVFGLTFIGYLSGIFAVSGGIMFIPGHAALVGTIGFSGGRLVRIVSDSTIPNTKNT